MGFTIRKIRTVGNGRVLTPKIRHLKWTIVSPMKHMSCDCTVTWSISRECSFRCSCTFHCQICNQTNICWVTMKNRQISQKIWCYFTTIQQMLVQLQIPKREVQEQSKLYHQLIHHVVILSEHRDGIGASCTGTVNWNHHPLSTWPKNCQCMSSLGNNMAQGTQFGLLGRVWSELGHLVQF